MDNNKLDFMAVDTKSLPESLALKLMEYKKADEVAQNAKKAFEAGFIGLLERSGDIPDGQVVVFGYRFGGLAIAFKTAEAKKATSKPMFVLSTPTQATKTTKTRKK